MVVTSSVRAKRDPAFGPRMTTRVGASVGSNGIASRFSVCCSLGAVRAPRRTREQKFASGGFSDPQWGHSTSSIGYRFSP